MGKKFLCSMVRKKLDQILDTHEDGELEAALDVKWAKFKPGEKSATAKKEASMGAFSIQGNERTQKLSNTYTELEQKQLMHNMFHARAAEVLPQDALVEVPMTHFEFS